MKTNRAKSNRGQNTQKLKIKDENDRTEFKTSLSEINEIIETISAFSNTEGGKIFAGVSNSGKIIGVQIGKGTIEELTNRISQNTDPKIHPKITVKKINALSIIEIDVGESFDRLVLSFGRPYKRVGKSTVRMTKDEYEGLILKKHKTKTRFDKQICGEAGIGDIDMEFVEKQFIPLYEKATGKKVLGTPMAVLESLNCIKKRKPTNAGILLFGKDPQKYFMNAYISLARYAAEDVDVKRLDYKEFTGNLFNQIDACAKYIMDNISVMSVLKKGKVRREDIPEYGWFSIRELITNTVCHRDYSNMGSKIIVKIFSDKIEFYNPGGTQGITTKNIAKMQFSRNPIISKILSKAEYIEELGEGWDKILKEHKEHPLKPKTPKISSDNFNFIVYIYSAKSKFAEQGEKKNNLSERQKRIADYLLVNREITTSKCAKVLKVSNDTALRELGILLKRGKIVKKGIGRAVHYILKS